MIQIQYMGLLSLATFNTHIIIKALLDWLLLLLSLLRVARHFNTEANMSRKPLRESQIELVGIINEAVKIGN